MTSDHNDFEIIHVYTRAEALADGVLVDATRLAKEAGFRFPVAVTSAVWHECVSVPAAASWQDENGRLWDILHMLRRAITQAGNATRVDFRVSVQNDPAPAKPVQLKALCGPVDDAEPVITVMFSDED